MTEGQCVLLIDPDREDCAGGTILASLSDGLVEVDWDYEISGPVDLSALEPTEARSAAARDREISRLWSERHAYTCVGSVRGCCGIRHRSRAAAERCIERDERRLASHGCFGDRQVVLAREHEDELRYLAELRRRGHPS